MHYIIEHAEEKISEWLELEYRHSSRIVGKNLLFTNVKNQEDLEKIRKFARAEEKSCMELLAGKKAIVLDPQAEKMLSKRDFSEEGHIIVGGILGDANPRGRTKELITEKLDCIPRSLGRRQLSVDGAVFLAKKIEEGENCEVADRPEIELSESHSVTLEYAIPVFRGKLVITPGLLEYLKKDDAPGEI